MKALASILLLGAAACVAAPIAGGEEDAPGWLVKDFADLTDMFAGQWSNDRQVFFADDAGLDPAGLAPRQHIEITPVLPGEDGEPETGRRIFEAKRTVEGEMPVTLVHTFTLDVARGKVRQDMAVASGILPPEPLGCAFYWSRDAGQFSAFAEGAGCDDLFPRPDSDGALQATASLSQTEYWVTVGRGEAEVSAQMRRARPFECWTAILRGAEHGDSGQGVNDWNFQRGVLLHDQGGEAELTTDEDPPRTVRLRLRDVDWTYGDRRPSLTLYVLEGESDRAVSYAWTEGGAGRVGINLRWLQASCTAVAED